MTTLWMKCRDIFQIPEMKIIESLKIDLGYDRMNGERTIQPNAQGMRLLALIERIKWIIVEVRRHYCKHPNLHCDGHAGPNSGYDDFYCPDCGWEHSVRMY